MTAALVNRPTRADVGEASQSIRQSSGARGWRRTTLGTLIAARGKSVNPSKKPNGIFELYSVPSFPGRSPEIIAGKEIGSNKQEVHSRSVLLCKINPRINRAWVVGDFSKHPKIASTEWIIFPENEAIEPSFLSYFLQQNAVRDFLAANASGIGGSLMRVKPATLRDFPFAYPEREEQERIVAEIEKQFTRLNAGVASLKRVQIALKSYRASVLKAACEGRLVPTEAELALKENRSYETGEQLLQRILKERREKWNGKGRYKEPMRPSVVDMPNLPVGWFWAGTEQLTPGIDNAMTIGPFGSNLMVKDYREAGVPLIFVREIRSENFQRSDTRHISKEKADELATHKVRGGDLVITKMGEPPGDTAIYPEGFPDAVATSDCIKLTPNRMGTSATFLKYVIRAQPVKNQIERITRGVAQKKVSLARFKTVAIPLPPYAEQQRIIAEIERRLTVVDEMQTTLDVEFQRTLRLRQSVLQRAFEGRLAKTEFNGAI